MSEIIKKLKGTKGIGIIAVALAAVAVLLLFYGNLFGGGEASVPNDGLDVASLDSYARSLEERIRALIAPISGVGETRVMVYLDCSAEYIYSGGAKEPTKILSPRVTGVAVVCAGGNDPAVRAKVTSLISSLFNVGSQHVSVNGG